MQYSFNIMKTCERCGNKFGCGAADKNGCWCLAVGEVKTIPAHYKDCLCPACIQIFAKPNNNENSALKEGSDFYYERGLMVFTKDYHLQRGECCQSGCRHCPF